MSHLARTPKTPGARPHRTRRLAVSGAAAAATLVVGAGFAVAATDAFDDGADSGYLTVVDSPADGAFDGRPAASGTSTGDAAGSGCPEGGSGEGGGVYGEDGASSTAADGTRL